jgi:hypothetical protein
MAKSIRRTFKIIHNFVVFSLWMLFAQAQGAHALRINPPTSFADAQFTISDFVHFYNNKRLHVGINYLRPADVFSNIQHLILDKRKQRLLISRSVRSFKNKQIMEAKLSTVYN